MFYPIQSIKYTLLVTKKIYIASRIWSPTYVLLTHIALGVLFILISIHSSVVYGILCAVLIWISIIDIYDRIIPDILLISTAILLLLISQPPHLIISIISIAIFSVIKLWIDILYKKSLIGWGDIKLIALFMLFLPIDWWPLFFFVCGISFLGTATLMRLNQMPFAPFIIVSYACVLIAS
jgi:prepilin signal peptidase PulO-like enzyme (type II secretory pathway)